MKASEKLSFLRSLSGDTQKSLANKLDVSQQGYCQYEAGLRSPKPDLLTRMADALNVSPLAFGVLTDGITKLEYEEDLAGILFFLIESGFLTVEGERNNFLDEYDIKAIPTLKEDTIRLVPSAKVQKHLDFSIKIKNPELLKSIQGWEVRDYVYRQGISSSPDPDHDLGVVGQLEQREWFALAHQIEKKPLDEE